MGAVPRFFDDLKALRGRDSLRIGFAMGERDQVIVLTPHHEGGR